MNGQVHRPTQRVIRHGDNFHTVPIVPLDEATEDFIAKLREEIRRAREKFPSARHSMVALSEEVGELAKAMLDEPVFRAYLEAVQVAAMAARVATEGDPSLDDFRRSRGLDENGVARQE